MNFYFRETGNIEFRSLTDLSQIMYNFSTGYIDPGALCAASTSTLLVVDQLKVPCDVYWLDCSEDEPKTTGKTNGIDFLGKVWDICYVPNKGKHLLLATQYGLSHAYNTITNKLEWNNKVGGSCITTDCYNYVVVPCDYNINMLSLSDG